MNDLTNKTWVVEYYNGLRFYLSDDQKNFMLSEFAKGTKQVVFEDKVLTPGFAFCAKAEELTEADNKKLGNWKCGYGFWHEKGDACRHKNKEPNSPKMSEDEVRKNRVRLEVLKLTKLGKTPYKFLPTKIKDLMAEVGLEEKDVE